MTISYITKPNRFFIIEQTKSITRMSHLQGAGACIHCILSSGYQIIPLCFHKPLINNLCDVVCPNQSSRKAFWFRLVHGTHCSCPAANIAEKLLDHAILLSSRFPQTDTYAGTGRFPGGLSPWTRICFPQGLNTSRMFHYAEETGQSIIESTKHWAVTGGGGACPSGTVLCAATVVEIPDATVS